MLLFDDEIAAALQVGLTVPVDSATAVEPLGQGDWRTDFTLLVGKLFDHPSLFVSAEVGVRLRSWAQVSDPQNPGRTPQVQYSDEVRYAGVAGWNWYAHRRWLESLVLSAKLEGVQALHAPKEDGLGIVVGCAASFLKVGPELVWTARRGLNVSLGGHYFVAGRSVPTFVELALGIGVNR